MTSFTTRVEAMTPEHLTVSVFAGSDADHRAHCGYLTMRGEEAAAFIEALPAGGVDRFERRSLHVEGDLAYITWNVGSDIPLGTDTFVVDDGKIVAQTFAMYAPPAQQG